MHWPGSAWVFYYLKPVLMGRFPTYPEVSVGIVAGLVGAIGGWIVGWPIDRALVWFFGVFNRSFTIVTKGYTWIVGVMLKASFAVILLYGGLLYLTYYSFENTPTGFIPPQDKGLPARQRPVARFHFGGEDSAGDEES